MNEKDDTKKERSGAEESTDSKGGNKEPEHEGPNMKTSKRLWTPYSDTGAKRAERKEAPPEEEVEEISDEEMRKRIEEALEKIKVSDVVLDMMITLSSLAYQRMGIPKEVNQKYRDMEQARLAIDCLDALANTLEGHVEDDTLKSLTGTIDNLKLNFVRES